MPRRRTSSTWSRTQRPRCGAAASGMKLVTTRTRTGRRLSGSPADLSGSRRSGVCRKSAAEARQPIDFADVSAGSRIRPGDYLALDSLLSDAERDLRDTIRAQERARVVPNVGGCYEEATGPLTELAPQRGKLGVLGM